MKNNGIGFWHPASLVCTCFGAGKMPFAPGTWGSLVGLAYFVLQMQMMTTTLEIYPFLNVLMIAFLDVTTWLAIGVYCSNIYEKKTGQQDSSQIVIDEFVGQYLTCIIAIWGFVEYAGLTVNTNIALLVCFVTFRFFDIVKRGPVGWVDRNVKGGWGVMLDDVVAGVFAGLTSALIFTLL